MLLALDYDHTYTADPDFWDSVLILGMSRGHRFICVTQRPWPPSASSGQGRKAERLPSPAIPIICAGDQFKIDAAREAGYSKVHVWIDDAPETVSQCTGIPG